MLLYEPKYIGRSVFPLDLRKSGVGIRVFLNKRFFRLFFDCETLRVAIVQIISGSFDTRRHRLLVIGRPLFIFHRCRCFSDNFKRFSHLRHNFYTLFRRENQHETGTFYCQLNQLVSNGRRQAACYFHFSSPLPQLDTGLFTGDSQECIPIIAECPHSVVLQKCKFNINVIQK